MGKLSGEGVPYGAIVAVVEKALSGTSPDLNRTAYALVPTVLNLVLGDEARGGWHTFKHPKTGKTWAHVGPKP